MNYLTKLLLASLYCAIAAPCFAQTIQLGSGTTESSNYNSSPVNIYYRRTICQFVYTAAELAAAGASTTSPITQIGFYVTESPIYNIPGYSIRMKHTTQTDVSSVIPNPWTTVLNSTTYSPTAGGYDMLTLSSSFLWDGTSNIAVEICWSRVLPTWNPSGKVRTYPTTNGYRYSWTDNPGNSCGSTPANVTNDKPQIQMVFLPGTSTIWTGATDTDWFDGTNWTTGVPTPQMDAIIPSAPLNQPVISGDARTDDITIGIGASLTLTGTSTLEVNGNWSNDGALTANSGKVIFEGDATSLLNGVANQEFFDLEINTPTGATIVTGTYNIQGNLKLNGGTFTTNNSVLMRSNALGTSMIGQINTPCSYTLAMNDSYGDGWNGGYVTVMIDGVAAGTYSASGSGSSETFSIPDGSSVDLVYTAGLYEWENSYTFSNSVPTVLFSDGPTPGTGTVYSTTSSCSFTNPVSGDIEAQRYIDAGETNWRFLSYPINGIDLGEMDDDFITSGMAGSDYPGWIPPGWATVFYSMEYYDETVAGASDQGYTEFTSMSDVPAVGQGLSVWSGDTSTGTTPFTIDWAGSINAGTISLPVSFTVSAGAPNDGWNLVGNPYYCTLDWDDADMVRSTSIDNAVYIWDPDLDMYTSYVSGIGLNGGSNFIAPGQAFFVKANSNSPAPSIVVNERCKSEADFAFRSGTSNSLRLKFGSGTRFDETALRFGNGATDNFDPAHDALKLYSASSMSPQFGQVWGGLEYSINSLTDLDDHLTVPLRVSSVLAGTYEIRVTDLSAIEEGMCLVLEDLLLGTSTNLITDSTYSFYMDDDQVMTRFMLHIVPKTDALIQDVSCNGLSNGVITAQGYGSGVIEYTWSDIAGNVLYVNTNPGPDSLTNLPAGDYLVSTASSLAGCPAATDTLHVNEPDPISVSFNQQGVSCIGCCDGSLEADLSGGTAPYTVSWDDPMNQTTELAQNLCDGSYTVTITDMNGCDTTGSASVLLATGINDAGEQISFSLYPNPSNGLFTIKGPDLSTTFTAEAYDLSGKLLHREQGTGSTVLNLSEQPVGLYIISITIDDLIITEKISISR